MAKDKLTDYSATNASNTDVGGVNINEGMLPSDVNNAIREVMTHLKDFAEGTEAVNSLAVDNININGNTISSTDTNGNINITPNGSGAVAFTTNATFGDNDKAIFGDAVGGDLQIYHDGSNSYIDDTGAGNLILRGGADVIIKDASNNADMIRANVQDSVQLFFNAATYGAAKLATTSTGVDVTGTVTADGLTSSAAIVSQTGGSNSAPAIAITSGSLGVNGITAPSANTLGFVTGTGERMRLTSAGRLGLGTTAPDSNHKLEVASGGTAEAGIRSGNTSEAILNFGRTNDRLRGRIAYNNSSEYMAFWTNQGEKMRLTSAGSLGLGTTAPTSASGGKVLAVETTADEHTNLVFNTANTGRNGIIEGRRTGRSGSERFAQINIENNSDNGEIRFYTAPSGSDVSERMRLDASGNLLVGGTSLGENGAVTMAGDGRIYAIRASDTACFFGRTGADGSIVNFTKDGTTIGSIGSLSGRMYAGSGDVGVFFDSTNNMITPYSIDAGDTVDNTIDLGYSSRRFKDGYFSGSVYTTYVKGNGGHTGQVHFTGSHDIRFVNNGNERGRFTSDGKFRLNTTANQVMGYERFTCNGAAGFKNGDASVVGVWQTQTSAFAMQFFSGSAGNNVGSISVTASATAFNTSSDRRLKSNIEDAASASDKIDAIQVRQFDWNVDDSHQDYGLIAQELQPIEPLAVTGDADSDEMMGVDYSKLVPMLIKEIQELRSRVAALEAN